MWIVHDDIALSYDDVTSSSWRHPTKNVEEVLRQFGKQTRIRKRVFDCEKP